MTDDDATARLEAALRRLGETYEPPRGWELRVLAAVQARQLPRRGWWTLPAFALGASMLLAGPPCPPALELVVEHEPRGPVVRGRAVHVGDQLHATATGGAGARAIWVYRNEVELVATCPGAGTCRSTRDTIGVDLTLASVGAYTIVALSACTPLPVPGGSYDGDLAAASAAGVTIAQRTVNVR